MIEWWLILQVATDDPNIVEHKHVSVTEEVCRETVRTHPYMGSLKVWAEGREWEAQLEFCVWTKNRVIQNYVEFGEQM